MSPIDTYRDAFLKFIREGMSYAEALEQFDEDEWNRAVMKEMFDHDALLDPVTRQWITNDSRGLPALFQLSILANFQMSSKRDFEEQAVPLMIAGWTSEMPECYRHNSQDPWRQCPVMSLYWRAPSKRPGKPGRKYLSTQQAYNAMKKAKP